MPFTDQLDPQYQRASDYMSAYYYKLLADQRRLKRLLDCPIREGRSGIETLLDETNAAINQMEAGIHWTQTGESS